MQVFTWVVLSVVISIAIFALQNSDAPLVTIKFLFWKFETSLAYTVLGSIALGILVTLLLWIPRAIRTFLQRKNEHQKAPSS